MPPGASSDSDTTLEWGGPWNDTLENHAAQSSSRPALSEGAAPSQPARNEGAAASQPAPSEGAAGQEYIGGALLGSDSSTEAPWPPTDLISINEELQDLGIVIGAAKNQIEDHKYARQLLQELDDLVTWATTAMSYIQVCMDDGDGGLKNVDSSRVQQARTMLKDVQVGWLRSKATVDAILETKKRSSEIIECGDGAAASSASGEGHKHARHD